MNGAPRWWTWVCGAGVLIAASCGVGSTSEPAETAGPVEPPVVGVIDTQPLPELPPPMTAPITLAPSASQRFACLKRWPLEARIGQLVWPATFGDQLESDAATFAEWGVGGAVVMSYPDIATVRQLADLKGRGTIPLVLAANEEGGLIQPFARVDKLAAAASIVKLSTDEAEQVIADHAAMIGELGIDVVFAPVVDLSPEDAKQGLLSVRTFSDDVLVTAAYSRIYVEAWQAAGVFPIVKHFPGQGSAAADPHIRAANTPSFEELQARDLLVYDDLRTLDVGVMVGHLDVPGLTDDGPPASLNKHVITDVLRGDYGFRDALVVTDALGMGAIAGRYTIPYAAELALTAGADVVQFTNTEETPDVIAALVGAVEAGRLSERRVAEAVNRVLAIKGVNPCAVEFD